MRVVVKLFRCYNTSNIVRVITNNDHAGEQDGKSYDSEKAGCSHDTIETTTNACTKSCID